MADPAASETLLQTPLYDLHVGLGARMVPFACYDMPVQFEGIIAEHTWTRENAGLFDVSHMGQAFLIGPDHETIAKALQAIVPSAITTLKPGRVRYTVLLNGEGGIDDDLMVTRPAEEGTDGRLFLVVNAARKDVDFPMIAAAMPEGVRLEILDDRALIALQGPKAAEMLVKHVPGVDEMAFMSSMDAAFDGLDVKVSRSGYTGEDGYEISVAAGTSEAVARALLSHDEVKPIGLGARDSLRLEAGLCLYGHDIDETTSPVEGDITFVMQKSRREATDFPGAARIMKEFNEGASKKRVGFRLEGRAPAREGADVLSEDGTKIGHLTSGGFAPSVGAPIAMGYVDAAHAEVGTPVKIVVRGRELAASVAAMPFVEQRYYRKPA
ncbi:glycine cleavage system aminomethyltransferase GcvT [Breoghania sp.]|uniref:glycine cleavage system aminomethyltransferase GcvT n=1 Tax=Breoghania sp. TaxID=2065378 RepID=UPI0026174D3E|nr:glycine cleavage system aminomethyltransferase GcvT [Breoghania sp.]MDJ0930284.1 glycine cleavage system aminomethyltransferase GcvT [Breoghania sp.]